MHIAGPRRLFTIGHSNHGLDAFLALLQAHGIEEVVDVRSLPRSGYAPHFDRETLREALERAGTRYAWRGDVLGGRPDADELLDAEGRADYARMAQSASFLRGLAELEELLDRRIALMCGEENPTECHRRLLIGRVLHERGVEVLHIRGDGSVESEEALRERERTGAGGQQSLFDVEEVREWKSTRSVSRRSPPSGSSAS